MKKLHKDDKNNVDFAIIELISLLALVTCTTNSHQRAIENF